MSLHTNCHAPRTSLYGRIQIGQKCGLIIITYLFLLFIYIVNKSLPGITLALSSPGVGNNYVLIETYSKHD